MYDVLMRRVLRYLPSEPAHRMGFGVVRALGGTPAVGERVASRLTASDPVLRTRVLGLDFAGPLGLAAGFDKDAEGVLALGRLGFGAVEIGTVTGRPQPGNPKPRLFRLVEDQALINRMGFNNAGAAAVAPRLAALRTRSAPGMPVLGVNIGKSKVVPADEAVDDYRASAAALGAHADYVVVNVSSPNTPGLRDLQQVGVLEPLLTAVRDELDRVAPGRRIPLLVKITVDLADDDVDAVADLAVRLRLDGVVATNTTISREGLHTAPSEIDAAGAGGLSGRPLRDRARAVVRRLRSRLADDQIVISVGGIEDAAEAYLRIRSGAALVQSYTGFVYGGLLWPSRLHRELAELLRADGFTEVGQAVGADL
ncbi:MULTISPECIES: quinone-dependent dihydroorotate dehydrogenase [unclassified Pseudonocardia]|uniref:quinone-dependent dihydroorotate dehydrogenase n=1 Tax=unclassified Pseudonocardia TaxID=2619320 RepID=UPI0001FFE378|nr:MULTISPECIES: quinone-dependent dihydroorotate dehydrogenase [unclassified Pseudonocardia]ALE75191.1 diguanylate cyclase [Pseudonocardia sp. EC080625-04]OLM16185.1 Dihydroorotate dehydrogenase [Pseudonocardia sp. Ae707_Ps1]